MSRKLRPLTVRQFLDRDKVATAGRGLGILSQLRGENSARPSTGISGVGLWMADPDAAVTLAQCQANVSSQLPILQSMIAQSTLSTNST